MSNAFDKHTSANHSAPDQPRRAPVPVQDHTPAGTHEILGWWIIPIVPALGIGTAFLTRRITAPLKKAELGRHRVRAGNT
jgi:hypothetical protein